MTQVTNIQKIRKKTQIVLIFVFALNVAALLGYGGALYVFKEKKDVVGVLAENIETEIFVRENTLSLQRLIDNTERERAQIASYFVTNDGTIELIEEIEALGAHASTTLEVKNVDIVDEKDTKVLHMGFSALGSWESIMYLTGLIEHLPYAVEITRIRLQDMNRETSMWQGDIDFVVTSVRE